MHGEGDMCVKGGVMKGVCMMKGGMCGKGRGMDGKGACVVGGVHGRGHAWQRTCMEGCAWQRGVNGGGCAWQGVCGKGTCMAEGHA